MTTTYTIGAPQTVSSPFADKATVLPLVIVSDTGGSVTIDFSPYIGGRTGISDIQGFTFDNAGGGNYCTIETPPGVKIIVPQNSCATGPILLTGTKQITFNVTSGTFYIGLTNFPLEYSSGESFPLYLNYLFAGKAFQVLDYGVNGNGTLRPKFFGDAVFGNTTGASFPYSQSTGYTYLTNFYLSIENASFTTAPGRVSATITLNSVILFQRTIIVGTTAADYPDIFHLEGLNLNSPGGFNFTVNAALVSGTGLSCLLRWSAVGGVAAGFS